MASLVNLVRGELMAWQPIWTEGAWSDMGDNADLIDQLTKAVREFAANGTGMFIPDGPGRGMGRLVVGNYRVRLARRDTHTFTNEDGEEITIQDAIVVLGVTAVDPNR
ncbi:MAG TPA: hypothetical protein VGG39_36725 [Polyangiaceae bacterium]|jgi:hypothetical protein